MSDPVPLSYAVPADLPPPGSRANVEHFDGGLRIVLPSGRTSSLVIGLMACAAIALLTLLVAISVLVSERTLHWAVIVVPLMVLAGISAAAVEIVRMNTRPSVFTLYGDWLYFERPSLLSRRITWRASEIDRVTTSFGTPTLSGRMSACLMVGSGMFKNRILGGHDKAELRWVAHVLNGAMGKL